jgi:hypothetical protein
LGICPFSELGTGAAMLCPYGWRFDRGQVKVERKEGGDELV